MIANLFFVLVFQGLALWAAFVALAGVMPSYFGVGPILQAIAKPARSAVSTLTPASVPYRLHLFLTVFWLLTLRVLFYLVMAKYGLLPRAGT